MSFTQNISPTWLYGHKREHSIAHSRNIVIPESMGRMYAVLIQRNADLHSCNMNAEPGTLAEPSVNQR